MDQNTTADIDGIAILDDADELNVVSYGNFDQAIRDTLLDLGVLVHAIDLHITDCGINLTIHAFGQMDVLHEARITIGTVEKPLLPIRAV